MNPLRVYRIYRAVFDWIAGLEAIRLFKILNRDQRNTFIACFLGWALDALDFFLVTFVLIPIGHDFGQTIPKVAFAITLTLMMRPAGADCLSPARCRRSWSFTFALMFRSRQCGNASVVNKNRN